MFKAVVQAVPERAKFIKSIKEALFPLVGDNVILHIDGERRGPYGSFNDLLKKYTSEDEYMMYMQDDILFADNYKEKLMAHYEKCKEMGWDYLGLFAPNRKDITEAYNNGVEYYRFKSIWMQACFISPKFQRLLREGLDDYSRTTTNTKSNDAYVDFIIKKHKLEEIYVCLPSLVQHDMSIPSSISHSRSATRMSNLFNVK